MAKLKNIRAGIAVNVLRSIPQSQCTGYLLENPQSPAFEVEFHGIDYEGSMSRGLDTYEFIVRGLASSSILDAAAQQTLDLWLESTGATSIKAALEFDRSLGGSANDAEVIRVGPIREFSPISSPGTKYYGAEWTLRVLAPGD